MGAGITWGDFTSHQLRVAVSGWEGKVRSRSSCGSSIPIPLANWQIQSVTETPSLFIGFAAFLKSDVSSMKERGRYSLNPQSLPNQMENKTNKNDFWPLSSSLYADYTLQCIT